MRKFITAMLLLLLAGCANGDLPSTEDKGIRTACLDGVTYYLFREYSSGYTGFGYMSVKLDKGSRIVPCKENR
jgi:hypothetical protein